MLTFLPVEFVHPVRVKRFRPLTLAMAVAWAVLAVVALADNLRPGPLVLIAVLAASSLYFAFIGVVLQVTRDRSGRLAEPDDGRCSTGSPIPRSGPAWSR